MIYPTVFLFLSLKLEHRLLKTAKEKMEQLSRALSESEFKLCPDVGLYYAARHVLIWSSGVNLLK